MDISDIKEVTCFSWGDSSLMETWSNVPYYLTTTLENKKIKVNRVDLSKHQYLLIKAGRIINRLLRIIFRGQVYYDYTRTKLCDLIVGIKIRNAIKRLPSSDLIICISYSFSAKRYTTKKVIMFCDWTIEYAIDKFEKRSPLYMEQFAIKRQDKLLKEADTVVSLFSDVCEFYERKNSEFCLNYIGNVINSKQLNLSKIDRIIDGKINNYNILFLGKKYYKSGLLSLLRAVQLLENKYPIKVDVIGMDKTENDSGINVHYHGYLDKSNSKQNDIYYDLLGKAKLIVNTTPAWAGFSGIVESMHHCTPVIVTKSSSFVDEFGEVINFGYYCDNDPKNISSAIERVFMLDKGEYRNMSKAAHAATLGFTWNEFIDKMLARV